MLVQLAQFEIDNRYYESFIVSHILHFRYQFEIEKNIGRDSALHYGAKLRLRTQSPDHVIATRILFVSAFRACSTGRFPGPG